MNNKLEKGELLKNLTFANHISPQSIKNLHEYLLNCDEEKELENIKTLAEGRKVMTLERSRCEFKKIKIEEQAGQEGIKLHDEQKDLSMFLIAKKELLKKDLKKLNQSITKANTMLKLINERYAEIDQWLAKLVKVEELYKLQGIPDEYIETIEKHKNILLNSIAILKEVEL
jgi:hypothetical protein